MPILIILPTFNECENLPAMLEGIRSSMEEAEILVVDDASPDGTAALARKLAQRLGGIHILERQSKEGLGSAYAAGFKWGFDRSYSIMVQMDADLSHNPIDIPRIVSALHEADLVIGSRYIPGGSIGNWNRPRRLLSRLGCAYARVVLDLPLADPTGGFRAWRAESLQQTDFETTRSAGYAFQIEMAHRATRRGLQIVELPIHFNERAQGRSKMTWKIALSSFFEVTRLRWSPALSIPPGDQARRR